LQPGRFKRCRDNDVRVDDQPERDHPVSVSGHARL
jgi:hypothetical protein